MIKHMRKVLVLAIVLYSILGYGCNKQNVKSDKEYKDSIAQADQNTALGNIKFGISEEEFNKQVAIFNKEQKRCIYNTKIRSIEGKFTAVTQKLYAVIFISRMCFDSPSDSLSESPFKEFIQKKFGKPNIDNNVWLVGNRMITTDLVYRLPPYEDLDMILEECAENSAMKSNTTETGYSEHFYYELYVASKTLFEMNDKEINNLELQYAKQAADEYDKEKKRMEIQIKKL